MTLTDLIDQHEKCREKLIFAINNDASTNEIQTIDAHITQLFNAIKDFEACTAEDIVEQVCFFLALQEESGESSAASTYTKTLGALIHRYAHRMGTHQEETSQAKQVSSKLRISLGGNAFSSKEMIQTSHARVSLFDTQFRYQFTSAGNAKFYNASPQVFIGKHVSEIIGEHRFQQRAKTRMEQCFSGIEQRYFHFLPDDSNNDRLMDCHMAPYYDSDNCVRGAYVAMADITDKLESARNLPALS